MDYDKYILVDYENIRDIDINVIDKKTKMIIIIREHQNELPINLIKKTQPFGNSIEWFQVKNYKDRNDLNCHIVCFLRSFNSSLSNKELIIYSADNGYDPLIGYLKGENVIAERVISLEQINRTYKNSFINKLFGSVLIFWRKLTVKKKICFATIATSFIGGIIALLILLASASTMVTVIDTPIRDEVALARIVQRINQEGIKTSISPDGLVKVPDENTARRVRTILIQEDLIPSNIDPWAIFDKERWTITDFERNVNFQRAQTQMITEHIRAIDGIDDVKVSIGYPKRELFRVDQGPVTASIIIAPHPDSDNTTNMNKIKGIHKILKFAIDGLLDENIVITDQNGLVLNDNFH
jgi:hypothetical protein